MSIDKIIKNNSVNKNSFELIKDLSKEDKTTLLNIFNFIDENENDNQKGVITTEEALNSFLKEVRTSIGEKYDLILNSIGLSHLKNDRNINGIIDIDDFSEEDLIKLENNMLLDVFDIKNSKGQNLPLEILKIFSAILHNTQFDEKIITTSFQVNNHNRNIIYDTETKTLKIAKQLISDGYCFNMEKYIFDEKGLLKQKLMYSERHKYLKDGEIFIVGPTLDNFAVVEGFSSLNEESLTGKDFDVFKEVLSNPQFGDKIEYRYDKDGKIIEEISQRQLGNNITISKTINNTTEQIKTDLYGNFISQEKIITLIDTETSKKIVTENYDKNGQLNYKITQESIIYDEPIIITDENGNNVKVLYKQQTIKEYPDGKVENEVYYEPE